MNESTPSVWCEPCRGGIGLESADTSHTATGSRSIELLSAPFRALTIGVVGLVALGAFETLAVATAMPVVAAALDGVAGYGLAFGIPTAAGIVGMVLGGRWSDARRPAAAVRAGAALFASGLLLCGLAPTMWFLVAGRAVQGLGTGLLGVALYVVVAQCYPNQLQARMFAGFAAAWVLPSLVGPAIAGLVVDRLGWRWLFLGVAVIAVPVVIPVLRRLPPASRADQRGAAVATPTTPRSGRLHWAVLAGVGAAGLQLTGQLPAASAAVVGVAATAMLIASAPRLLPAGTLRARQGLPATILLRGFSAGAFVAAQVFLPLVLVRERDLPPTIAGLVLTAGSVAWAGASWIRGRTSAAHEHRLLQIGMASIAIGILTMVGVLAAHGPTGLFLISWMVTSAGMGLVVPTLTVLALRQAPPNSQGATSSALQISDALFAALALAGAGTLFSHLVDRGPLTAYLAGFIVAAALAVVGCLLAGRSRPAEPVQHARGETSVHTY